MFSRRLPFSSPQNRIAALTARKRAAGAAIRDLTASNPTRVGLEAPPGLLETLAHPQSLSYEPAPLGLESARRAVAGDYRRRGVRLDAADVALTASTSEAYALLFKLLCDPGDSVLAPVPSYPLFDHLAALEGVHLVPVPLGFDGHFHIDAAAVEDALGRAERPRAILVVSPSNPAGSVLTRAEHARLDALCAAHDLALVCDEVFADYPAGGAFPAGAVACAAAAAEGALTFSLGGLSKSCGLPQLKLGWIAAGGPAPLRRDALARLELIADAYLSVSTPVQVAAPALLAAGASIRAAIAARVDENRRWLAARLPPDSGISLAPAAGGWSAVLRLPATRTDEDVALALLDEHDTLVHPGYLFDFPSGTWLVVSLLCPPNVFRSGIDALVDLCR